MAQKQNQGWLSLSAMNKCAEVLGMPPIRVYEVTRPCLPVTGTRKRLQCPGLLLAETRLSLCRWPHFTQCSIAVRLANTMSWSAAQPPACCVAHGKFMQPSVIIWGWTSARPQRRACGPLSFPACCTAACLNCAQTGLLTDLQIEMNGTAPLGTKQWPASPHLHIVRRTLVCTDSNMNACNAGSCTHWDRC